MKNKYIFIFFAALIISLNSCKVGPNFSAPELETPERFYNDSILGDSTISVEWFELLKDTILLDLIDTALVNNKDLLIALSRINQSRAYLGFTKADMYPSFGYTGGIQGSNFNSNTGALENTSFSYGAATMNWEIDFWGKYRRANESARSELIATEFSRDWIRLTLISEVVETYFQLLDYDRRVGIAERTLESRTESLDIIGKKFFQGVLPELDYNQAQIQQAEAAQAVPFYKRQVAVTNNRLSILLGQNPQQLMLADRDSIPVEKIEIPVGLPSDLLLRRPDVQQAMQQLRAQNAKIGVAQAMRFPSISLTGMLGVASSDLSDLFGAGGLYQVSGALLGPIFEFGKNKRRVEMEKEKTNQYRYAYEKSVLEAFQEVENALVGISTIDEEYMAIKYQLEAAENAARLSNKRYDGGVASFLEVLDSERTYFNAEITASEVRMQQVSAYIRLYKALGGGWIVPDEHNEMKDDVEEKDEE